MIADQLNADETLSAANVRFVPENTKDIDFEIQNALGKQGIVGVVMTPTANYIGNTSEGELAYDLRDITIQIVENPPVNRGLSASITALDAAQKAQELLSAPKFTTFGIMNPVSIEQGEENSLIVAQAKFNCNIHATRTPPPPVFQENQVMVFADGSIMPILYPSSPENVDETINEPLTGLNRDRIVELVINNYAGQYAFAGSWHLKRICIGSGVQSNGLSEDAFINCPEVELMYFKGKTLSQVEQMANYPWGLTDTSVIKAELEEQTQPLVWTPGGYNSNGALSPGVFYSSDYIPVEPSHNITWKWGDRALGGNPPCFMLTYNADKQLLTYWTPNVATGQRTFNVGAQAHYIRYSVMDGFQNTTFVKDETTGKYIVRNGEIIL